jgi:RNA polymerase sigma-B factor
MTTTPRNEPPGEPAPRKENTATPRGGGGNAAAGGAGAGIPPRAGDGQVALWLEEYTRLRDAGGPRGGTLMDQRKAQIVEHYGGLVESVARRFLNSGEPLEDLTQEGFIGLLSALENFDAGKGVKFSTYATHFIAGAMRHCLRDRGKIIKEPAWLHELSGKINRASDGLTQSLGRAPHAGEIARVLNLTEEAVEEILSTRQVFQVASFQSDPDGEPTAGLVDPEKIKSDRFVTLQLPIEDRIVLEGAVEKLKALEQKVLYEFFYKDLNQTEIARKFGISCNYVSHILKNSTRKLRRILGEAEVRDRGRNGGNRGNSIVDAVTGLYAATHIQNRLEEELSRASRGGLSLAVVHVALAGLPADPHRREEALSACGAAVRGGIRRVDIAGRVAPDALLVLLPHTGVQAIVVAERLLTVLGQVSADRQDVFRAAVGLALYPEHGQTGPALLDAAASRIIGQRGTALLPAAA